jgi:hypothetical protein
MILFIWAGYALAGAGVIEPLPLTKLALTAICAVYLVRAVAFPFLKPVFPANTQTFWLVSSGICLVIGLFHLVGLVELWAHSRHFTDQHSVPCTSALDEKESPRAVAAGLNKEPVTFRVMPGERSEREGGEIPGPA